MISFTIITTTPLVLRNQLVSRGIITLQTVEGVPNTPVPVFEGLEYTEVPNPIITSLAPVVLDTRRCYLVKLVRAAEDDECTGEARDERALLLRTKLGKWVAANSTADTLVSADGRSWPARKVGTTVWLVADPAFGVWQ